ncbi:MAG: F0F1 ATP synthase subunit I [Moraxellaceae bacterium]|nr:MAG: F0F1 ATP synthase subunit I [Moraxellaceae bacterium]
MYQPKRQSSMLVDRRLARGLTIAQAIVIPVSSLLAYCIAGGVAAQSAALGALLCWLGSAYFAWQAFRQGGASASKQIVGAMYKGMIGKFVIVIVGFILIFRSVSPLSMPALLAGFVLVQAVAWLYPLWAARQQANKQPQ